MDETQHKAAFAGSNIVMWGQDLALRYTWIVNPRLGLSAEAVIGKTDREVLHGPSATRLERIKRAVIRTGEYAREAVVTAVENRQEVYDLHIHAVRDHSGVSGIACVAIEITPSLPPPLNWSETTRYRRDDRAKKLLIAHAAHLRAKAAQTSDAANRAYLLHLAEHWLWDAQGGGDEFPDAPRG